MGNIESILNKAIEELTRKAVYDIINKNLLGSGVDSDIKSIIRAEAERIIKTKPFQEMIKDSLKKWINK